MPRGLLEGVIDQLAEELSRSVVINDPSMRMIYASAHYGDEDPVRIRALLHHGADPRVRGYVLAQGVSTWTRPGTVPPIVTWSCTPGCASPFAGTASCWAC